MSEIAAQPATAAELKQHNAFFRQSGWLMIANIGAGAFMWAVHFLSRAVGPAEYGVFVAFLSMAMVLPTFPLQMVLAQQTAKALAEGRQRELAGIIRLMWLVRRSSSGCWALWPWWFFGRSCPRNGRPTIQPVSG